jgi:hypothetical protein
MPKPQVCSSHPNQMSERWAAVGRAPASVLTLRVERSPSPPFFLKSAMLASRPWSLR